jgi:hypothetical protein
MSTPTLTLLHTGEDLPESTIILDPEASFYGGHRFIPEMLGIMTSHYMSTKKPVREPRFRWLEERIADAVTHGAAIAVDTMIKVSRPNRIRRATRHVLGHSSILLADGACKLAYWHARLGDK